MKSKKIVSMALLLASLTLSQAQSPIAQWSFENDAVAAPSTNPATSLNDSAGTPYLSCFGMTYATPSVGTNAPDVLAGKSSDTGANGIADTSHEWRIRGQNAAGTANGWSSAAPVGAQGMSISVSTVGFDNIQVGFDWYLTTQGEANMMVQYSTDGGNTWNNVSGSVNIPSGDAGLALVNNTGGGDSYSANGYYLSDNLLNNGSMAGQDWFTNLNVTITDPAAANNPNFEIEIVNASTGASCVSTAGTALNNSSGNWRFDNIYISGTITGAILIPPAITPSAVATVDAPFTDTFTDNANWRNSISAVSVNGSALPTSAYSISAGQIVFTPSASSLLQTAGSVSISITATGYSADLINQYIAPGAAKSLGVTSQPLSPTGNGGTLVQQPVLTVFDQYENVATNGSATYMASPSAGWSFGTGSGVSVALNNGTANFTNLSANSAAAVSGASITFTVSGASGLSGLSYTTTNSTTFNIPAPRSSGFIPGYLAVEQLDAGSSDNSTFSILELNPSISNSVPVNIFPVPATGTNALRQSSSASTGDLADSQDGTLLCFSAGQCGDSSVSDVTTINQRGAGTFNGQGNYVLQTTYAGDGADSDQARSAVTVDDVTYFMGDKGGVYTNNETTNDAYILYSQGNPANVRAIKSFGGIVFALQQEGSTDPNASVMTIVPAPSTGGGSLFPLEGFPVDGNDLDFYALRSGNNGTNYDTIYYIDGTNSTSGSIWKYYFTGNYDPNSQQPIWDSAYANWPATGAMAPSWPTPNGGDGLCAVTNVNGGVDLYYTTGKGSTVSNSVVHVYDSGAWNQPINLTETNVLYVSSEQVTLKGIAFAPLPMLSNLSIVSYSSAGLSLSFNSPAANASFTVWSSTNLALPFNQWNNLGHPTGPAGASGITYSFTDSSATARPATFYRVTSP